MNRTHVKLPIFMSFGIILFVIITMIPTEFELYLPLVLSLFILVFVLEKALLGDSLSFSHLTAPSFFILLYIVMMSYPSTIIFSKMDHPIKYVYFIAVQSVLITFPIGVGLANLLIPNPSNIIKNYLYSDLRNRQADFKFLYIYKILLVSSLPILGLYFVYSEHIQLIEVSKAYPTNIEEVSLRFAANDLPKVVQYAFELLRRFILPFTTLYAYFMYCSYKAKWRYVFWSLFSVTLIVSSMTLDRAPVVALFVIMILAYLLARNESIFRALKNIRTITIFVIAVLMAGLISVFQYQTAFSIETMLANSWYVLSYRILQDPAYMASLAFQTYNADSGFLYGTAIRMFSVLPGFTYVESLGGDSLIAAPVTFVGDLWRNWGWPGVIVGSVSIGFIYQLIQLKCFTRKSAPSLSIYVIYLAASVWIIFGNALGIVSTSIILLSALFGWLTKPPLQVDGRPSSS